MLPGYHTSYGLGYYSEVTAPYLGQHIAHTQSNSNKLSLGLFLASNNFYKNLPMLLGPPIQAHSRVQIGPEYGSLPEVLTSSPDVQFKTSSPIQKL